MTETEWLAGDDPCGMLDFLGARAGARKLRLFACACCRLAWALLTDQRSRAAVEAAEKAADGLVGERELFWTWKVAVEAAGQVWHTKERAAADAAAATVDPGTWQGTARPYTIHQAISVADRASRGHAGQQNRDARRRLAAAQATLVRDLFGNPFRPVSFDPGWRTPQALALARTAYEERRWEELPLLGDALEEAGCADTGLIAHLRGQGPHARGCWALDLLLGESAP